MRLIPLLIITVVIATFKATICPAEDSGLLYHKLSDKMPGFQLNEVKSGKTITFVPDNGKPSVLMFFSIKPSFRAHRSVSLASDLKKLDKIFNGRVIFLAIYSDDEEFKILKKYIADGLISLPVLNDPTRAIYNKYGVFMLPITVIMDTKGQLQSVIPYTSNTSELINNNLKLILGDWTLKQFKNSLTIKANQVKTKEEKAYIRRVNYGRVMQARGMYSAALREFNTARKIMPHSPEALIGIGQVQLKLKKWNDAEEAFHKALKINKESDEALAGLGLTLYRKGDEKQALPILENALISTNQDLEVVISLAAIYEKNGNIVKAIRLNKLAISMLWKRLEQ